MPIQRSFALTAGALIVASLFGTAQAQEVAPGTSAKAGDKAELETVTVTARRRTEKAQDVPAPISIISGRDLEAQRIYQVQDLQQALPNVTSQFLHARQSSVSVRGIGNNTANEGLEGSVGIYLDNVFLGRPGQAVFDLLDVEQIDLLRGPQGTLFGKNTTAGVLNISTRQPSFEREGGIEASYGSRNYSQFKGYFSAPISDTVAFRVSAYNTHDDGWVKNISNGKDLNEINRQGVRGQVLVKPNADFSLRVIAEYNSEDSSTGTLIPYSYGPLNRGTATNLATNATTYAAWARSLGATNVITDPNNYQVNLNSDQQAKVWQSALSAEANWNLADGFKLTSVTAWRDWNFRPKNDLDSTTLNGFTGGFDTSEKQFSQEIRLASPAGKLVDYVIGAYYHHQNTSSDNHYETGPLAAALTASFPQNNLLTGRGEAIADSLAGFGQATWHLTPRFDLTTGLRYTNERKEGHIQQNALSNPGALIPGRAIPWSVFPIFQAWDSGTLKRTDESLSGLLTGSYRFSPQVLGYATLSRGEKSGGYNVNSIASVGSAFGVDAVSIKPEVADNAELGLKTNWLNNRLQVNGNFFLTKIKDYQAATTRFYAPTNGYLQVLTNVGDLTSKGFELDLKAQPTTNLSLNLNGAYTIAKFDDGTAPTPFEVFNDVGNPASTLQGYGKGSRSIAGNWVNGAPKLTVNVGGQYRLHYENNVEQYFNGNYAWRAESYGDINNSALSKIPSYGVVNLATGWRANQGENGRWDLSLWVKNAFDKHYFLGVTSIGNNFYLASAGQPRTIGASLRYDFF